LEKNLLFDAYLGADLFFGNNTYAGDFVDSKGLCAPHPVTNGTTNEAIEIRSCDFPENPYHQNGFADFEPEAWPKGHPQDIQDKFLTDARIAAGAAGVVAAAALGVAKKFDQTQE
jgi:hypothetical protein